MNILFLHGLESPLSDDKRVVLQRFGTVLAPDINYRANAETIQQLYSDYRDAQIDMIIGSSMGGFAGYYLSIMLDVPALLFNPALPYRSVEQQIPVSHSTITKRIEMMLGAQDTVIAASDTKAFITENIKSPLVNVTERPDLGHRIPLRIFEQEVTRFTNFLKRHHLSS